MIIYEHNSLNSFEAANDACLMDQSVLKQLKNPVLYHNEQFKTITGLEHHSFKNFADKALAIEQQKFIQGDITKQTLGMFISRLRAQLTPYFSGCHISTIQLKQISEFILELQDQHIKPITIKQYLGLLKRILLIALEEGAIYKIPSFPKLKTKSIPRGSFVLWNTGH